jgi:hypothetical protein
MMKSRYHDPACWVFNEADRKRYNTRYWRCPVRLVQDGLWRDLWRANDLPYRGGAPTSVLPVLALHTWPDHPAAADGWTAWTYLSRRRVAALAGVNKDTATRAYRRLVSAKLMEVQRRPRAPYEGGCKIYYRLAASLYPRGDELYAEIRGNLFYGGTWCLLPSPAYRHLYTVLACLDPIGDEEAYWAQIAEVAEASWDRLADEEDFEFAQTKWGHLIDEQDFEVFELEDDEERETAIRAAILAARRARAPVSIRDLERYSGLQRSTVVEALHGLQVPLFGNRVDQKTGDTYPPIALIIKGRALPNRPTWFTPDRRAWGWFWPSEFLNTPEQVDAARQRYWPHLAQRRGQIRWRAFS